MSRTTITVKPSGNVIAKTAEPFREPKPGLNRGVVLLAFLAFGNFLGTTSNSFLPLYLTGYLHLPVESASLVTSVRGLAAFTASYCIGAVMDRFGPRATAVVSLAGIAIAYMLVPSTANPVGLAVLIGAVAVGRTAFRPSYNAQKVMICTEAEYARAYSLFLMATNGGLGLAAIAGSFLMTFSPPGMFYVDALVCGLVALAASVIFKSRDPVQSRGEENVTLPAWRNFGFLVPCSIYFLVELSKSQAVFLLPISLTNAQYITPVMWGYMQSVTSLSVLSLSLVVSTFLKAKNQSAAIAAGAFLLCSGLAGTGLAVEAPTRSVCWGIYCIGEVVFYPALMRTVMARFPAGGAGRYTSFYYSWSFLAAIVGPIFAGYVYVHVGSRLVWSICFGLGVVAAATATYFGRISRRGPA